MTSLVLAAENIDDLTPEMLADASTDALKTLTLQLVSDKDELSVSKKVKFLNDKLLPLFRELERRNPIFELVDQVPVVQGVWLCLWSTIPFQDILPGRIHKQSYQIFADNGLYANMARYRPGHNNPLLSWASRWLLSYDLMILQTYAISDREESTQQWDIENVGIKQDLRIGPAPLSVPTAMAWFQKSVEDYNQDPSAQQAISSKTRGVNRAMEKKYKQVSKAKPTLEHLYIDRDFRLVKSVRDKNQRPSYTIATRL